MTGYKNGKYGGNTKFRHRFEIDHVVCIRSQSSRKAGGAYDKQRTCGGKRRVYVHQVNQDRHRKNRPSATNKTKRYADQYGCDIADYFYRQGKTIYNTKLVIQYLFHLHAAASFDKNIRVFKMLLLPPCLRLQ